MKSIRSCHRISTLLRTTHHHHHHHHLLSSSLARNLTHATKPTSFLPPTFLQHHFLPKHFYSETPKPNTRTCWNCHSGPTSDLFLVCDSCRCVQPLDPSVDYFRLFGLDRKYDIEEDSLEGKYKAWQKKLHPDLVHSKSESEREYAAEQSSRIIDAYRTLNDSLSRAIYLMKLRGVDIDEEQTVSDPDLLAEVMEIRESVEDATDSQALKQIQAQVQEKMNQWTELFARAFNSEDTEDTLNAIRRMTYYKRANEEIVKRL